MKYFFTVLIVCAAIVACNSESSRRTSMSNDSTESARSESVIAHGTPEMLDTMIHVSADGKISIKSDYPVVIDFGATWCGPCRDFGPVFEAVAARYSDRARFMSVDTDRCPKAAEQFDVTAIPQVSIVMPDGTIDTHVGYIPQSDLERLIDEAIANHKS